MSSYFGSYHIDDSDVPRFNRETELLKSFPYYWRDGTLAFYNDKGLNQDGEKPYRQRRPNLLRYGDRIEPEDRVEEYLHLRGVPRPLPLYNLLALLDPSRRGEVVWVVEGEGDVDTLTSHGLLAVSSFGGATKWRWRDGKRSGDYSEDLIGRDCVVCGDNDPRGREHVDMVWRSLRGKASRLRVLKLPGLPDRGDITDWFEMGGTVPELWRLVETIAIEIRSAS